MALESNEVAPSVEFKISPIVYLYFEKEGNVLLLERSRGRLADYFSLPAGHIEPGEDPSEAVAREAREELGVQVIPLDAIFANLAYDVTGRRIMLTYKIESWSGEPQNMEPEKHKSLGWYSLSDFPDRMTETARAAIRDVRTGRRYRAHRTLPYPIV